MYHAIFDIKYIADIPDKHFKYVILKCQGPLPPSEVILYSDLAMSIFRFTTGLSLFL